MKAGAVDLSDITLQQALASCEPYVGMIGEVRKLEGGMVSHVYRVAGQSGQVIVKIRKQCFSGIPELGTDPALVSVEAAALEVYGRAIPGYFPRVLQVDAPRGFMVMTDVFASQRSYADQLSERCATGEELALLGRALRLVHDRTSELRVHLRPEGDLAFRDHTLEFCLRSSGHPILFETSQWLQAIDEDHLILGDPSPKNIEIYSGAVTFCDLDNVHRGCHLYDIAYVAGHILVHHAARTPFLSALVTAFMDGYGKLHDHSYYDETLFARVAAAVMLYRLGDRLVPYPLPQTEATRQRLYRRVYDLLSHRNIQVAQLVEVSADAD